MKMNRQHTHTALRYSRWGNKWKRREKTGETINAHHRTDGGRHNGVHGCVCVCVCLWYVLTDYSQVKLNCNRRWVRPVRIKRHRHEGREGERKKREEKCAFYWRQRKIEWKQAGLSEAQRLGSNFEGNSIQDGCLIDYLLHWGCESSLRWYTRDIRDITTTKVHKTASGLPDLFSCSLFYGNNNRKRKRTYANGLLIGQCWHCIGSTTYREHVPTHVPINNQLVPICLSMHTHTHTSSLLCVVCERQKQVLIQLEHWRIASINTVVS